MLFIKNQDRSPSGIRNVKTLCLLASKKTFYCFFYIDIIGFPIFGLWAYLVKVTPETRDAHWIGYLRFYWEWTTIKSFMDWTLKLDWNICRSRPNTLPSICKWLVKGKITN